MKTITMKKTILNRVALFASLVSVMGAYANTQNEALTSNFGAFLFALDKNISNFCNSSVKTPYNILFIELKNILADFKQKIEPMRNGGNSLTSEFYALFDYTLSQASVAYGILDQYNGRPSSDVVALATAIRSGFNTELVFTEIIRKLKTLKCKAIEAKEDCLVKKIDAVITMLEKKRKEWNAKADWALLAGLKVRMDCK